MTQPKDGPLQPDLCASGGSPWSGGAIPLGPRSARTHLEVATQKSLLQAGPTCLPSPRTLLGTPGGRAGGKSKGH